MRDDPECRCYVNHLIAEHRRLHALLRQMRVEMAHSVSPDEQPSFAGVKRALTRLREELTRHFAEEEGGGCLDEAVSRCPRLSDEERRIEAEHPVILAKVDRLIEHAMDLPPNLQNQIALKDAFDELCAQLCAHEGAENALLEEGFGANFNGSAANTARLSQ